MATARKKKHSAAAARPQFCTACGETLEGFWLDPAAGDVKRLLQRMARCKAEGRFHGKFCARLWIAGGEAPRLTSSTKRMPGVKVARLKTRISKKLTAEARRTRTSTPRSR